MPIIPNKKHIIWLDSAPPERVIKNVLQWTKHTIYSEVYFWVRYQEIASTATAIQQKAASGYRYRQPQVTISDDAHGVVVEFLDAGLTTRYWKLRIYPFESIPPLTNAELFWKKAEYPEMHDFMLTIAKFWVLQTFGGVCIDYDTFPFQQPYVAAINAPMGILFYQIRNLDFVVLTPQVVASTPGHPYLAEIATRMDFKTEIEEHVATPRPLNVPMETAPSLQSEIDYMRESMESMTLDWQEQKRIHFHQNLQQLVDLQQARVAGPRLIYEVISNNEMQWVTPNEVRQPFPNRDEMRANEQILLQYSFTAVTGYEHAVETEPRLSELS